MRLPLYQRGKIQEESRYCEHKKHDGSYAIVGVNSLRYPPRGLASWQRLPRCHWVRWFSSRFRSGTKVRPWGLPYGKCTGPLEVPG